MHARHILVHVQFSEIITLSWYEAANSEENESLLLASLLHYDYNASLDKNYTCSTFCCVAMNVASLTAEIFSGLIAKFVK